MSADGTNGDGTSDTDGIRGGLVRAFVGLVGAITAFVRRIKPNLMLFVVLLFFIARELLGHIVDNITAPVGQEVNQLNQSQGEMRRSTG